MSAGVWARNESLNGHNRSFVFILAFTLLILVSILAFTLVVDATGVLDNFEWKVPGTNRENGFDQWTEAILTDEATGDVYVVYQNREPYSQNWSDDSIVCGYLNPSTGTLTDRWVFHYTHRNDVYMYLYFPRNRQYLVNDGHFYFLYYTREDSMVHLRIDNLSEDCKRWYIGEFRLHILGVRDGSLLFLVNNYETNAMVLFTVSLEDFSTITKDIFTYDYDTVSERILYRNGAIHSVFWRQTRLDRYNYSYDLMVDKYYIGTGLRIGPTAVDIAALDYYGTTDFDVDAGGNYHILVGAYDQSNLWLHKVRTSGSVVDSYNVDALMDDLDVNFTTRHLNILINRSGHIYLIGTYIPNHYENSVLCSFVLSPEYDGRTVRHIICTGSLYMNTLGHVVMSPTGEIFITWYAGVDDFYRVFFSYQIPLTPDLEVNLSGFRFQEVRGTSDPIRVSMVVNNVGRADSSSHWVEISYSLDGNGPFTTVMDLWMDIPLAPGDNYTFARGISLPQGNIRFRLRIHDVIPYENNELNNVIVRWLFVSINNPPTVLVELPEDGSTLRDEMTIKGITDDLDLGGDVTMTMTGLPSLPVKIDGRGRWTRFLNISDVPSGVYILAFQAHDGELSSEVVYRKVRLARGYDDLSLVSLYPPVDVTLIEGERLMFHYNATDPLTSSLDYYWALGSDEWVRGGSAFLFEAVVVGVHRLRVEVSNGFSELSHSWNVTVIELIYPSIGEVVPPGPDVVLGKREEERFSIEVINPHDRLFTLKWSLDGKVLYGHGRDSLDMSFERGGCHTLSVMLFSTLSQESMTWIITVTNQAPEIVGWTPMNRTLTIDNPEEMAFEVLAVDGDVDPLRYEWSIDGDVLAGLETQGCSIDLPFVSSADYQVTVVVSDGEATAEHHWVVHPLSTDVPGDANDAPEEDGSLRTTPIQLLIVAVIIVVVTLSFLYVRWKGMRG